MKQKMNTFVGIIIVTVIVLGFVFFLLNRQRGAELIFISSTPQNNEQLVPQESEIIITVNRNITEKDGSDLEIKISPAVNIDTVYQENKIRISPETEFRINTDYEVQVIYKNKAFYTLNFKTFPITREKLLEDGGKQTEADLAFNENYKQFLTDYPWYTSLPIEKADYRIVYDFEKESFRIRFKKEQTNEKQIEALTEKALEDLRKIGVEDPIDYHTLQPNE